MKYTLTGGPSCGKSSVLEELEKRGYSTLDEVAREVIDNDKSLVNRFEDLQRAIFYKQKRREARLNQNKIYFLDRGLPDIVAYCLHKLKYIPGEFVLPLLHAKYDKVFILDRLPFVNDGTRIEKGDKEAAQIHDLIGESYCALKFKPIRVPVFKGDVETAVKKRADYILEMLN